MKIGIIGGGLSGTICAKYALERGHEPKIFERTNETGGVYSLIYDRLNYNLSSSKFMTSFTDMPHDEKTPVWMSLQDFKDYIDLYIKKFNLIKYYQFGCQVINVKTVRKMEVIYYYQNETLKMEFFDKVVVCTGLNQNPKFKEISGIHGFRGLQIHTHDVYTNPKYQNVFKNKKVLILGIGESSFDIGHEIIKQGGKLYLQTDKDVEWFAEGGVEVDKKTAEKYDQCFKNMSPSYFGNEKNINYFVKGQKPSAPNDTILTRNEYSMTPFLSNMWHGVIAGQNKVLNYDNRCSHGVKELCHNDKRNVFAKYLVKRTKFLCDIHSNKVKILRGDIYFNFNQVYENGKFIDDIDIIVYATGYRPKLEFLPEKVKNGEFIKNIVSLENPNIAFVGFTRPTMGSILIIAETQVMWLMLYFENRLNYQIRKNSFFRNINPQKLDNKLLRHLVIGNYYMDDLALDMKVKPNLKKFFFTDFKLWYYLFFGMVHPMNYRLEGVYYLPQVRENIHKIYQKTFELRNDSQNFFAFSFLWLRLIFIIIILIIVVVAVKLSS